MNSKFYINISDLTVENPKNVITMITKLMDEFGYSINDNGYKVLPDNVRVIQDIGPNDTLLKEILNEMEIQKISVENVSFGV